MTRASEILGVTPGTLSKAIRYLEDVTARRLFVRVGRTLELTDSGRRLYVGSDRLIEEFKKLVDSLEESATPEPPSLKIASFEPFATYLLGEVLGNWRMNGPVRMSEVGVGELEKLVAEGGFDVGITYIPFPDPALRFRRIVRVEFGVFARQGQFKNTRPERLPYAAPIHSIQGGLIEQTTVDSWPTDIPRQIRYRLTSLESALELARRGLCAVFIPEYIAGLHNQTVRRPLRLKRLPNPRGMKPVRQSVYVVTRAGAEVGGVVGRFSRELKAALENGTAAATVGK